MTSTKKIKKPAAKKSVAKTKSKVQTDAEKIAALNAECAKISEQEGKRVQEYYTLSAAYIAATKPLREAYERDTQAAANDFNKAYTMLRLGYNLQSKNIREAHEDKMKSTAATEYAAVKANEQARMDASNRQQKILDEIKAIENKAKVMPKEGAFTFYKKAVSLDGKHFCVVKLKAPANAQRYQSVEDGFKLRVSEAKVVSITRQYGATVEDGARSYHYPEYIYKKGDVSKPTKPFDTERKTCSSGIYGFMRIEDAKNY